MVVGHTSHDVIVSTPIGCCLYTINDVIEECSTSFTFFPASCRFSDHCSNRISLDRKIKILEEAENGPDEIILTLYRTCVTFNSSVTRSTS